MTAGVLTDPELTRSAQAGNVEALGLLLARHQAGMRAVALSVLGHRPEVDDVLQDAALVALRRIGDVRDPDAVGAWLRMVVRNASRMRLRAPHDVRFGELWAPPSEEPTPEQVVDEHALRDWIWHAMDELSPQLRLAVLLRHFSGVTSYEQIAAACDVPVGTVRSRLSQARAKMAQGLLSTSALAHDDADALNAARRHEGVETLLAAERGEFAKVVAERWSPEVRLLGGQGQLGGRELVLGGMDSDLAAGVRQRLVHSVASRDLTIWEMDLIGPADDPDHCPPSVVWLLSLAGGRIERVRLFHPS
ncbi:MAG: polymerase subunit sigma-24 [Amycolatopsis sp.]|jgi:RNA polymerase sigma factor (sigma-70 family)|uniref:RNA polymerase sigma factor n=1 Tax=Amycolatopsis sp. TaxID=37632 RepID=UPI00261DEEC5|nr:sigma-70 family RNA polymerase sigma factor [Amycolatopsis sp.]MCU1680075.1 polymerase subunit sigma-24 [Amycolatopsis sp.]